MIFDKKRIITALMTPFHEDETINEEGMRALVRYNLGIGVEGFYVCGSTGEACMMTLEERKRMLECVADENNGAAPVIAHVGAIATRDVTELAKHAARQGVAAVSAIPPYYFKFRWNEILAYYYALADHADGLPVIVYNFPAITGIAITEDMFEELFKHPCIRGVKHTCNDIYAIQRVKARFPEVSIFNGYDEQLLGALAMGADGAIGSTYNLIAPWALGVRDAIERGDIAAARVYQEKIGYFVSKLGPIGTNPALKYALTRMGVDVGPCRRPFITGGTQADLDALVGAL